jgi:D-alanyl-D-alanine carboxypeptidase
MQSGPVETVTMTPRLAVTASWCREIVLPALVLAAITASGFAEIDHMGAAPIVDRLAQSAADARSAETGAAGVKFADASFVDKKFADTLQLVASVPADIMTSGGSVTAAASTAATPAVHEPEPAVTAALPETSSSETPPPEASPQQAVKMAALETGDADQAAGATAGLEACSVAQTCVDRYLWTLYQRTPKEDAIKNEERRKVTVKRKGRLVTVTRTFTSVADEDFSWKDPKAAEKAGMPMADYVIGGVDPDFRLKLFQMLRAAEEAGLAPGITSAFRDDYRQSIASGLKAANDRSYHGGSLRGGYGHGLAADIVSVNGATRAQRLASSETLWKWVDAHGKEFGLARPYLDRDPPHVAPIDGKEYADHHRGPKPRQAASAARSKSRLASAR